MMTDWSLSSNTSAHEKACYKMLEDYSINAITKRRGID